MSKSSGKKMNISGIWAIVVLLALLVAASAILLGNFIKRYTAYEKNVISVMADAQAIKDRYNDPDLPAGAVPGVTTEGLEAKWETETSIDLFKTTYSDANGNVTVQSNNGDKVIAPGTTNYYIFTIKNTGNISLDYSLVLDGVFQIQDHPLPFYVRLRCGYEWLVGDPEHWIHVDELGEVTAQRTLPRNTSDTYVFEWQWPYEADKESDQLIGDLNDTLISADANDTKLGDIAVLVNADFRLQITTTTMVTPGAIPVFRDGSSVLRELVLVCITAGLGVGALIFLLLFLLCGKVYLATSVRPSAEGANLDGNAGMVKGSLAIFQKAKFGKHTFSAADSSCKFRLKRGKVEGTVSFGYEEDRTVITVDRSVRALELSFNCETPGENAAFVASGSWAAIDKQHNVHTPDGVQPPDPETKCNTTASGLCVDKRGKFTVQ